MAQVKSYLTFLFILLLFSCSSNENKISIELSEKQKIDLIRTPSEYDFSFDYYTNDSTLLMLRKEIKDNKKEIKNTDTNKYKIYSYQQVNDSIGIYFIYYSVPSLLGGFEGIVGTVSYTNDKFTVVEKTSTIFNSFSEKEIIKKGKRIFTNSKHSDNSIIK